MIKSGLAFHCHHDTLIEVVSDYDERVKFIKESKPAGEQALRLRLFQLIPEDRLPGKDSMELEAYFKTREAYFKTREAYDKARQAYDKAKEANYKAWKARNKAKEAYFKKYQVEIEELHKELCPDCPWDGTTIFPLLRS